MSTTDTLVEVAGDSLFVRRITTAEGRPTLVFLHDSLGCVELWRDFPARLAEATGCNALLYDRKGYGRSVPFGGAPRTREYLEQEADVLQQLLSCLGTGPCILFGHSDGASIALIAAARYPEAVMGVISEAAHIFVEEATVEGVRAAANAYRKTDLKDRLARYHGEKTDALFRAWTDTWLSTWFRDWNIGHLMPRITCPVLVIQGEMDEYGTTGQVSGITAGIRGVPQVALLPGVGHTPHKEAPTETFIKAQRFIKTFLWTAG